MRDINYQRTSLKASPWGEAGEYNEPDEGAFCAEMQSSSYAAFPLIRLAIRSTPSPVWEKAFIVVCYARNLAVLPDYRNQPSLIPAPNYAPVARRCNRRRACAARPKGKYSRGRMALAPIRARRIFPVTGRVGRQCRLPA